MFNKFKKTANFMIHEFAPENKPKEFFVNDNTLTRFAIARNFDLKKATKMWKEWVE